MCKHASAWNEATDEAASAQGGMEMIMGGMLKFDSEKDRIAVKISGYMQNMHGEVNLRQTGRIQAKDADNHSSDLEIHRP